MNANRGASSNGRSAPGIWWVNWYDSSGRRHREKIGDRELAIATYQRRKEDVEQQRLLAPRFASPRPAPPPDAEARRGFSRWSFAGLVKRFSKARKARLSPHNWQNEQHRLRVLVDLVGPKTHIAAIQSAQIEDTLRRLATQRGLQGPTLNRYHACLSSLFKWAVSNGMRAINPVVAVKRFKENPGRVRYLPEEDEAVLRKVIQAKCPQREPELDLALSTGIRRGEQFGLRWRDVDLKRGFITVWGKTGRRTVPLSQKARLALGKLYEFAEGSEFVVRELRHRPQGRHITTGLRDSRRWFEECVKAAGIPHFTWHDLRHTFASRLMSSGVSIIAVQRLLGHKNISQTVRYSHIGDDELRRAVGRMWGEQPEEKSALARAGAAAPGSAGRVIEFKPRSSPSGAA